MRYKNTRFIIVLGLLSAIGPLSIDMYLPGFPSIAANMGTGIKQVTYSLSSFFLGISFGQLLFGPLMDRFGKKTPLYFGLALYVIASMGCMFSLKVEFLIFFRFLQAVGACAGLVAPRAIVRDLFPSEENPKIFSMLIMVLGVSPILAPSLGSFLVLHFGWQSIFLVLMALGFLILLASLAVLPRSSAADPNVSLKPMAISGNYWRIFKVREFYQYGGINALVSSSFYCYLAGSPDVFMHVYKFSPSEYGYLFAFIAFGLIGSSQVNILLLRRFSAKSLIRFALYMQYWAGLSLIVLNAIVGQPMVCIVIGLIFIFICFQGLITANSTSIALSPFNSSTGSASALIGALQMGTGAIGSVVVSYFSKGNPLIMVCAMFTCSFLGLIICLSDVPPLKLTGGTGDREK